MTEGEDPALNKLKSLNNLNSKYIHWTGISNLALMISWCRYLAIPFKLECFEFGRRSRAVYYSFITNIDRLLKSKTFLGPDSHNIARGLCETQVHQQA